MRIPTVEPEQVDVDMTPLIDIVFQLIAFFMVITNFEQTQADERVKLPRDLLARPPEVKPEKELVVNVGFLRDKTGKKLDPQPYVFWAGENLKVAQMKARFQQEARLAKAKKQDPSEITVSFRADADVPTGVVQQLMKMAQDAGFELFVLKAAQAYY